MEKDPCKHNNWFDFEPLVELLLKGKNLDEAMTSFNACNSEVIEVVLEYAFQLQPQTVVEVNENNNIIEKEVQAI